MGTLVALVAAVESIPLGILLSAAIDRSLQRRPHFSLRLALFVLIVVLPDILVIGGAGAGMIGDGVFPLVMGGLLWGLVLVGLVPFVLFYGPGPGPGSPGDGGDDSDPGNDQPSPLRPISGTPLPDAEQSSVRKRGRSPKRSPRPRRRGHEPGRAPSRSR